MSVTPTVDINDMKICYVLVDGSKATSDIFYFTIEDSGKAPWFFLILQTPPPKFKLPALLVCQVFASQRLKAAGHDNQYGATVSFLEIVPALKGSKGI